MIYNLSLFDDDDEAGLVASIEGFRSIDHRVSDLNITLNIEEIECERLTEILRNLITVLQSSPHLQDLTRISLYIKIGYYQAQDTYVIDSNFSEFVIELLNSVQRPELVRELDLDFDFPFCLNMNQVLLESRTQYLIQVLQKFDKVEDFSLQGYCLYDALDSIGAWIKNHNTLSTVSLGTIANGAGTSMAYIREVLKNLKIQDLEIIHSFHHLNDSDFVVNSNRDDPLLAWLDQNITEAIAEEVLDELRTLTQIRNHPSLKTFNFEFEIGELAFVQTNFVGNCCQTFSFLQKALLESRSLETLDFIFRASNGYIIDLNLSTEDIQCIQTFIIRLLEKNHMLRELSLQCFDIKIDPQLFLPYLNRNLKVYQCGDQILRLGLQLLGSNPPILSHLSRQGIIARDEVLLNQTIPSLTLYYDSIPVQHHFFGNPTDIEKLKSCQEILESMVAEFFLLTKAPLNPRCVNELYAWLAAKLLSYLEVQDLVMINKYNGLFKRQYRLENNNTPHSGSLTAAGF